MIKPKVSKNRKSNFLSSVFSQKTKPLYTYVNYICNNSMSVPTYQGLKVVPSISSIDEMLKHGKSIDDIVYFLEEGYTSPRKRKKDTIEKWIDKGKKTFNAVIVKDYNAEEKQDVWVLIHFGKFTKRK